MAELKTKPTDESVESFLEAVPDERKRRDSQQILELMKQITGLPPVLWGTSIVGFGSYHYRYASGHSGDACLIGFSPRKDSLSLYVLTGFPEEEMVLEKLGKHKRGGVCLYIKRLEDVDLGVLRELVEKSYRHAVQRKTE